MVLYRPVGLHEQRHTPRQWRVTLPAPSSVQVTPGVCVEHGSCGGSVASMQAQVGVAMHDDGIGEHVYASGIVPPSAAKIPGGWSSQ